MVWRRWRTRRARRAKIVVLNAGVALYAADRPPARSTTASAWAREAIASGAAKARLDAFVATTRKLAS